MLTQVAQGAPRGAAQQREEEQLRKVELDDHVLLSAKAPHDGAVIEMPDRVALRRQGQRQPRQGDADQHRQGQKLLRPVQGRAQFRPRVPYALYVVFLALFNQGAKSRHRIAGARRQ